MCGIAGLFMKTDRYVDQLGALVAIMLHEMRERGPDSAGFAIYSPPNSGSNTVKVTVLSEHGDVDWANISSRLATAMDTSVDYRQVDDHAVFAVDGDGRFARQWLIDNFAGLSVLSVGTAIEIFKAIGDPDLVGQRLGLAQRSGTHAIAHSRMATESAVTTNGSHPFSTGPDTCLVHNGSLSNHNQLREVLENKGQTFQTENDSEVAAGYLAWRLDEGDTLTEAFERALDDLDGFYTFAAGTRDGFAVVRDPIACKPALIAETDDWVAMASEYRAIVGLPGAKDAKLWEPEPGKVYSWSRET